MKAMLPLVAALLVAPATLAAQQPDTLDARVGAFEYHTQSDPFTDVEASMILSYDSMSLDAVEGRAAISWGCSRHGLSVTVGVLNKGVVPDSNGQVLVKYRIDQNPPSSGEHWDLKNYGPARAIVMPRGDVPVFTEQAKSGAKIVVRVGCNYDFCFSLAGLTQALRLLPCAAILGG